jgi:hypothetical protein
MQMDGKFDPIVALTEYYGNRYSEGRNQPSISKEFREGDT